MLLSRNAITPVAWCVAAVVKRMMKKINKKTQTRDVAK